jgi:hypothetical protein
MKTIATIFAAWYLVLMLGGCAPRPTYGDEEWRMVRLQTKPDSGYRLYVIPDDDWPDQNPESLLNDPKKMAKYETGISPWEIKLSPYRKVLVAINRRSADPPFLWTHFTPGIDAIKTLDFTPAR